VQPARWWWHLLILAALLAGNFVLYHGALDLGFFSVDDGDYVQNNPYLEHFNAAKLKHILTQPYAVNYAPANLLSYVLDVALAGGKDARAIHLSNVAWHGWVVCMVYFLAFTIRAEIIPATAAALLFLLHPAHVEVVAWISSRKDLVATGFATLAAACYLKYRKQGEKSDQRMRIAWYFGSVNAFLLASAGKQSVVLLPAVLLTWDLLVERRRDWQMLADKIPFGLITLLFGWMTWHAQPSTNQTLSAFVLVSTELVNLGLLTGLGDYVLYRTAPDPAAWSQWARLAIMLMAVLVWVLPLIFWRMRQPGRASLGYWILISMVPPMLLSFVVPITDRYLFLPSVGFCLLLGGLATAGQPGGSGFASRFRSVALAIVALLSVVWGIKTSTYLAEWSDPRTVWYGASLKTKNPQVNQFLGEVYQNAADRLNGFIKSGDPRPGTNDFALAGAVLGSTPLFAAVRAEWLSPPPARTNTIAYREQLWSLAWEQFEKAVARRGRLSAPNLFMARGRLLVSEGKFKQAIPEFQTALQFAETSSYDVVRAEGVTHALFAIGVAHWQMGDYKQAETWLLKAQATQKKSGRVWLGNLDQEVERIKALAAGPR
jgi:hypothetical protein